PAEDGIRDYKVTGVQTCALPIFRHAKPAAVSRPLALRELPDRHRLLVAAHGDRAALHRGRARLLEITVDLARHQELRAEILVQRSEERRVGKECRARWAGCEWNE